MLRSHSLYSNIKNIRSVLGQKKLDLQFTKLFKFFVTTELKPVKKTFSGRLEITERDSDLSCHYILLEIPVLTGIFPCMLYSQRKTLARVQKESPGGTSLKRHFERFRETHRKHLFQGNRIAQTTAKVIFCEFCETFSALLFHGTRPDD